MGEACAQDQDAVAKPLSYGQWLGALGGSGLRRSLANGSDLGELVNRATTYRLGLQLQNIYLANPANGGSLAGFTFTTDVNGFVAQSGSLIPIEKSAQGKHSAMDFTLRRAVRDGDYIDANSDRLDVGYLTNRNYFANGAGYFGINLIIEQSKADVKFVNGERSGDAYGLRVQAGEVLSATWAWSTSAERIRWSGDGFIYRPSGTGPILIFQDVEYGRSYVKAEVIGRYALSGLMGDSGQLRWRSGFHYLETNYEDQLNSLNQPAREPFGPNERLSIVRTGAYLSWRVGSDKKWSPYSEWLYDYEFENNMNAVVDDPHTISAKLGIARLFTGSQRIQIEVQRYQGFNEDRARNGINMTAIFDL
jgi:hypothetical protein